VFECDRGARQGNVYRHRPLDDVPSLRFAGGDQTTVIVENTQGKAYFIIFSVRFWVHLGQLPMLEWCFGCGAAVRELSRAEPQ
jgi:hypothetical protein